MDSDDKGISADSHAPAAPLAWYGGKAYYAKWIIANFTPHRIYVEPYCGMANVLFKKTRSEIEVINDLDSRIVNFFRVLRCPTAFEAFKQLSVLTPYSRQEFSELCNSSVNQDDAVQSAWAFFVVCRQARGGLGMNRTTPSAWASSTRTRRGLPESVSKYLSAVEGLDNVVQRLREVIVEHLPAIAVMRKYDSQDTLFYCDPPYPPDTRHGGRANVYGIEMSEDDHIELLTVLHECRGSVVISSYDSPLYSRMLDSWHRTERPARAHIANSGQARTEVIWMNKPPSIQHTLF